MDIFFARQVLNSLIEISKKIKKLSTKKYVLNLHLKEIGLFLQSQLDECRLHIYCQERIFNHITDS